jgi:hypothetical protein
VRHDWRLPLPVGSGNDVAAGCPELPGVLVAILQDRGLLMMAAVASAPGSRATGSFGQTRKVKGHANSFAEVMNIRICRLQDSVQVGRPALAECSPHHRGLQIQSAPHLVPGVRAATPKLSPANRSRLILHNKIRSDMLLAHVRKHQADLDGKISATETHAAQQRIDPGFIRHRLRAGEAEIRDQEAQPLRHLPGESRHPYIHKARVPRSYRRGHPSHGFWMPASAALMYISDRRTVGGLAASAYPRVSAPAPLPITERDRCSGPVAHTSLDLRAAHLLCRTIPGSRKVGDLLPRRGRYASLSDGFRHHSRLGGRLRLCHGARRAGGRGSRRGTGRCCRMRRF